MKKNETSWNLFAALLLAAAAATANSIDREALIKLRVIPDVVADFGRGERIEGSEVKAILLPQVRTMLANKREVTEEEIHHWAINLTTSMIDQQLLLQQAVSQGISVDLTQGQSLVMKQRRQLGERTFEQMLDLQGLSEMDYARKMAENLAVQRWIETVVEPRYNVTVEEARAYYEQHPEEFPEIAEYHVSHILLAVSLNTPYEELLAAQELATELKRQLQQGADFDKLAREHSDCPSKADGGDLGFLPVERMPEAFEEVATELDPGEVGGPVRTPQGYHIIKAHEFKAAGTRPFQEVRDNLIARLEAQKLDQAMRTLTQQLRQGANIKIHIDAP